MILGGCCGQPGVILVIRHLTAAQSLIASSEFLAEDKVEVAAAACAEYLVKAVGPVYTHHTHHRQEYANTDTGAAFEREWIEVFN